MEFLKAQFYELQEKKTKDLGQRKITGCSQTVSSIDRSTCGTPEKICTTIGAKKAHFACASYQTSTR